MLNITIDFSKKEEIEIKFSREIPAKVIKRASIPYVGEDGRDYMEVLEEVIYDLKKTHPDDEIFVATNFPAVYEGILETATGSVEDILSNLLDKAINIENKIMVMTENFKLGDKIVTPVSLIDMKYRKIINRIKPDQYTTNIIRLVEAGIVNSNEGNLSVVYNFEEKDTEVVFFNEDNIPIAYTKTVGSKGIKGLADIELTEGNIRTPIEKRRIKSLMTSIDKRHYAVDLETTMVNDRPTINVTEDRLQIEKIEKIVDPVKITSDNRPEISVPQTKLKPKPRTYQLDYQGTTPVEPVKPTPSNQQQVLTQPTENVNYEENDFFQEPDERDIIPEQQRQGKTAQKSPENDRRVKSRPSREEHYIEDQDSMSEEEYQEMVDYGNKKKVNKKNKKPNKKSNKANKPKTKSTRGKQLDDDDGELDKKKSPKVIAVLVALLMVISIAITLTGKMVVDMIKGEGEQVTIDQDKRSVPLTTYVSSSMTSLGIRPNKVNNVMEDGLEKLELEINNISDDELIQLQSRLEIRCIVDVEDLSPNEMTEDGNRNIALTISYDLDEE